MRTVSGFIQNNLKRNIGGVLLYLLLYLSQSNNSFKLIIVKHPSVIIIVKIIKM